MKPLGRNPALSGPNSYPVDRLIAGRAGCSHGIVSLDELLALGVSAKAIKRRIRDGWLTELFPGAFLVGHHNVTRRSYWKAATVSCGPGSALSHRAGAQLQRLSDLIPGPPHVTILHERVLQRPGILVHRTRELPPSQITRLHGIPVTTVARTLVDFAAVASPGELRAAVWAAARLELLDTAATLQLCDASRGRKGVGLLRSHLREKRGPVTETRSPLEDLFLSICSDFDIRMPAVNVPVLDYIVDLLWLPEGLIVEVDGWGWHRSRESFEGDRRRDARLGAVGYHVQRFTHERLASERALVAGEVLALLDRLMLSRTAVG